MNEKQYKEQRVNLLNETQQLINEGKVPEAEKKMEISKKTSTRLNGADVIRKAPLIKTRFLSLTI